MRNRIFLAHSISLAMMLLCSVILCMILPACTPVMRVIDGDTILISSNELVRYIGIDTPEREQPLYEEARAANARLLQWKKITFEADVNDRDVHGRLLRYVFADGELVNAELVRMGYALVYRQKLFPEQKYFELLKQAADEAAKNGRGIWGMASGHVKLKNSAQYYLP
jgi:micrococcal nuclease